MACLTGFDAARSSPPYPPGSLQLRTLSVDVPLTNPHSGRTRKIPSPLTSEIDAIINVVMKVNVVCCFSPNPPRDGLGDSP